MRAFLLSILSAAFLVLFALILVPFFVSTDLLKSQVEQIVKEQSKLNLDIQGDVSFSLLTGFSLSAENVSLRDPSDAPLFSVEQLDFSLALSPLLSGKADITGLTLKKPTFSINKSTGQQASAPTNAEPQNQTSFNQNAAASTQANTSEDIDLSAIKLRSLTIHDGRIVSSDDEGHGGVLVSGIQLAIRIPDFNGTADLSGSIDYKALTNSFTGSIDNVSNAINGKPAFLRLDIESPYYKAALEGELAHKSPTQFVANYALNAANIKNLVQTLDMDAQKIGPSNLALNGSLLANSQEIQVPSLSARIDGQKIDAALRLFLSSQRARPLIRVAIQSDHLDLDKLLNTNYGTQGKKTQSAPSQATPSDTKASSSETAKGTPPDLSALTGFDATLDARISQLTAQNRSIRAIKFLGQLQNGMLSANLKSAQIAKGSLSGHMSGDLLKTLWNGSINAKGLDLPSLAPESRQTGLSRGIVAAQLNFAAMGLDTKTVMEKGNIAGTISLSQGNYSNPALGALAGGKKAQTISDIAATISLKGLDAPAEIKGNMRWNGEAMRVSSMIGLSEALSGQSIPASATIQAKPLSVSLSGRFNPAKISLSGSQLKVSSPSSRNLLSWLGQPVSSGTPNVPLSLDTKLTVQPAFTELTNLTLAMGQSKGRGEVKVDTAGKKPKLEMRLAFDRFDVTPFMGDGKRSGRSVQSGSKTRQTARNSGSSGKAKSAQLDFSALNQIDADIAVAANSLIARDIVTGAVALDAKLSFGQLNVNLSKLDLYGGKGTGSVSVSGHSKPATMTANFNLSNLNMHPFLRDAIDLKALAGKGNLALDLSTTGNSQNQLVQNLNGTANTTIRDGQLLGINIPQMLRSLRGNILEGWASSASQNTDFSALTASFTIRNGVAHNNDLQMLSPLLRLTGAGSIDLAKQRINYRATPKLIKKLKGQGGLVNADGVPIPIIIKGKLAKPRIYPDIPGILENPQAILQGLQSLGGAGKAAAKGIQRLDKVINKELNKQSERLGVDLNKIINPNGNKNTQQNGQQGQQQKPQNLEQQLFNNITKGLFGN